MKELIDKYKDIIIKFNVISWDIEPESYRLKGEVFLIDNTILIIKDYLFSNGRKYSYQWQTNNGEIIIRWDNAPHWKEISTFPHHKHEKNNIFPSRETTLEDVLNYIHRITKHKKNT